MLFNHCWGAVLLSRRRATGSKAGPSWQRLQEFDASPNLVTRSEPELSFNGEKLLFQAAEPESLSWFVFLIISHLMPALSRIWNTSSLYRRQWELSRHWSTSVNSQRRLCPKSAPNCSSRQHFQPEDHVMLQNSLSFTRWWASVGGQELCHSHESFEVTVLQSQNKELAIAGELMERTSEQVTLNKISRHLLRRDGGMWTRKSYRQAHP